MENLKFQTCCFFGHREIEENEELVLKLKLEIEKLIDEKRVSIFLFGSNSRFDDLCYRIISQLKERYSHIKRVYVRASYADIGRGYERYLATKYEESYCPEKIRRAGRASYVERNKEMIDKSSFCIIYYDKSYLPPKRKKSNRDLTNYQPQSGTALAYAYALRKEIEIINVFDDTHPM